MTKEEYAAARAALLEQRASVNQQIEQLDADWVVARAKFSVGDEVVVDGVSLGVVTKRMMVFNVAQKKAQPHAVTDQGHRIPIGESADA